MNKYKVGPGRLILRDGWALVTLHRVGSDSEGYTLRPDQADSLVHEIVDALNRVKS